MLLLSLSIFFHYDLLHCEQGKATGKDDFMDYTITEIWWNGTPGINQMDRITPQNSFLPTPIGWTTAENFRMEPPTPYDLEAFDSFLNMTEVTPSTPRPWHYLYPGLTPPPNFPSDYRYPTTYPSTVEPAYIPSPTGPTPKKLPRSSTLDPEEEYVKKWQQEIYSHAEAKRSGTPTNVVPRISPVFNYDYTPEGFPDALRRIRKKTEDTSSGLKNSVFEDPTPSVLREIILLTMDERNATRNSEFKDEASLSNPSKEPAIQKSTKNTQALPTATTQSQKTDFISVSIPKIDDDIKKTTSQKTISSFVLVVEMLDRPATIRKEELRQSDQTVPTTLTTVKESLRLMSVTQSYFEMIEGLHEGYMMVFLIELTRLVATKEGKAVHDVVKHTDKIVYGLYQRGQLQWLGKSLIDVITKVARLLKKLKIEVLQYHAANLHRMLSQRHQELSVEVNRMLEYADMLYEDDEGRLLFDALKEFAAFPNISLTGYWLCNSLIHDFLRPYRRLKDTRERQDLMDSVNLILKTRLSSFGFNKEPPLRYGDVKQADSPPHDAKLSTMKELVTQREPHSDTTLAPKKRKRKRHHRSHKRKRKRKRYTNTDLT